MTQPTVLARFYEKVDSSAGGGDCHLWTGRTNAQGYGLFHADGKRFRAHRWLLGYLRGAPLRWDEEVKELGCHHCDNPPCVNRLHLYVGDHSSNLRDAYDRGLLDPTYGPMKTHCKNGHEFTLKNTYRRPDGGRDCRRCKAVAVARCYARNGR